MKDGYTAAPLRANATLMRFDSFRPGAWLLSRIEVGSEVRGRGIARELLARVLADADDEQVPLYLSVEPDGTGLDDEQLRAWYGRSGFVPDLDTGVTGMVREPVQR